MGYKSAMAKMQEYHRGHAAALLGERGGMWFTSMWTALTEMLATFGSEEENKAVAAKYASAPSIEKPADHIRLDYVCCLRREVRKQYVSGEDGVYTDVTPFRHGVTSAQGARLFDLVMDNVVNHAEAQAKRSVPA